MDLETIKELMAHLEGSKLKKLVYKQGDFELHLEKESEPSFAPSHSVQYSHPHVHHFEPSKELPPVSEAERAPEASGKFVTSPMVGTFYNSPGPGQGLFVKVGDQVTESTVVCIIEAMKVMNEVKAGFSGTIAELLTDTAQPVEFGTRLFRIT